ncbi:DUF72 domain-containing protein [Pelagibacterium luteolum]|uniref:Uncharacterized conserved protein YecE, DUF72 family n=1 Tax=Pelagibacterium luteolum TaxID=440168 RepID=A0A1G7SQQ4_9HYPH|nr:DUF72 domain-containing protein [Pelagibacterium luteolum]SDG25385.1 Uncharacterized conserved protein YecE, DUF72 family [Pelagibacterium luteolum]
MAAGKVIIGVGGWTFEPWRGPYYPDGLTQKRELEYMGSTMTGVEVNGTFYGSQKPESFRKWHDEVPDDFVFTLKGTRYATNKKVLGEAGDSVNRFVSSGIVELKDKLGPINWQLAATKKFDPDDFEAFLKLLPREHEGRTLRHALETRHESFANGEAVDLARKHGVALITGADAEYQVIADATADFVYLRLQGTSEDQDKGYSDTDLDRWAERIVTYAKGGVPDDLPVRGAAAKETPRNVFAFVISGFKEKNPAAAMALIERVKSRL